MELSLVNERGERSVLRVTSDLLAEDPRLLESMFRVRGVIGVKMGVNAMGERGVEAVCEAVCAVTQVESLDLDGVKLYERGVLALARVIDDATYAEGEGGGRGAHGHVKHVSFNRASAIRAEDIEILAGALSRNSSLRSLSAAHVPCGKEKLEFFCEALKTNRTIEHLNLSGGATGADTNMKLMDLLTTHPSLSTLILDEIGLGDVGLGFLCKGIMRAATRGGSGGGSGVALRCLSLQSNGIAHLRPLAELIAPGSPVGLLSLNLAGNYIWSDADAIDQFAAALSANSTLLELDMSETEDPAVLRGPRRGHKKFNLTPRNPIRQFAGFAPLPSKVTFREEGGGGSGGGEGGSGMDEDDCASVTSEMSSTSTLTTSTSASSAFAQAFAVSAALKEEDPDDNARLIASALCSNTTLQRLYVRETHTPDEYLRMLLVNTTLQECDFSNDRRAVGKKERAKTAPTWDLFVEVIARNTGLLAININGMLPTVTHPDFVTLFTQICRALAMNETLTRVTMDEYAVAFLPELSVIVAEMLSANRTIVECFFFKDIPIYDREDYYLQEPFDVAIFAPMFDNNFTLHSVTQSSHDKLPAWVAAYLNAAEAASSSY